MAQVDSKSAQQALDMMLSAIGKREADFKEKVTILGKDPVLASRHRFGELMAAAQAALGMALSDIWVARGGKPQSVTTSVESGLWSAASSAFVSPKQSNFRSLFSKLRVALAICLSIFVNSIFAYDNPSGSTVGPVTTTDSFINNSGTISSPTTAIGINSTGTQTAIDINNSGTIFMGGYSSGIFTSNNSGTVNTVTNSGTITAVAPINLYGSGSAFTNSASGTITILDSGDGVSTLSANQTVTNHGVISGYGSGIYIYSTSVGLTINNSNLISVSGVNQAGINNAPNSSISSITNTGSISATGTNAYGIYNKINSSISSITNTGSISATGTNGYGIKNIGTISSLVNSQTGLTYTGVLPTNYNIIINSTSSYGKLAVTSGTGTTTFGIYGAPFLTSRTYAGVLTNNVTVTTLQAKYDNMTLALVNNALTGTYDLTFTGASLMGTQQSLVNTANALAPIYAMQNAVLVNSLTYDCTLFDVNNICISVGGRNTQVSAANGLNNTSALLIAAYRPHPNYRIGAYADQNLSVNNAGSTVSLSNSTPLIGVFGAWTQNQEGTGAEVRVSAAYGQKDATITRQVVGLSEPGSGSSTLNSQGAQVTAKYGFGVMDKVIVSPYVGVRYTQNNMAGYTENTSSTVTTPLTYGALNTNATTALAGVGASYKVIPTVTTFASAGVETDTNTSNGTYSATGINGLTPVNFNPNPVRTRPTATVGAYYDIVKNQRFGVTGIYRQEAYQAVSSTTVMATYTIGL